MVVFVLIQLGCTELGVAWELAGLGSPPALFTVRNRQGSVDAMATGRLVALGLIDPAGVIRPDLLAVMAAFAQSPLELDLRFPAGRGVVVRAAVVPGEGTPDRPAFLAVVTNGHARLRRVPAEAALAALVDIVPPRHAARGPLVTLPMLEVFDAELAAIERGMYNTDFDHDATVVAALARRGVAVPDAHQLVRLAGSGRLRAAEFGITLRDRNRARRRCPRVVRLVDTRAGRAIVHERGDYLVVRPADSGVVVRALAELRDSEPHRLGGNRLS